MTELPLVIAGGGIGGVTTALACAALGIPTRVLERAGPADTGAGVQIPPNAGRILDELGLGERIGTACAKPDAIQIHNRHGRVLASMPLGQSFGDRYGAAYRTIHRADLLRILLDALESQPLASISTGCAVTGFEATATEVKIFADTASRSEEIAAPGLIGADGIGSAIRTAIGGAGPAATGFDAWRAVIAERDWPSALSPSDVGLWLGPRRHVVHYPVRRGAEFNVVVTVPEGEANIEEVSRGFANWGEPIRGLLAADAEWHRWPIRTATPLFRGRSDIPVTLLGDAAHAMAPFLAQGGAIAIEDAAVIGRCIAAAPDDLTATFSGYAGQRRERVTRVHRAASRNGTIYHLTSAPAFARDTVIRLLRGTRLQQRYDWIYRWRP